MLPIIGFALAAISLAFGYGTARQFVRTRLRYVDTIHGWRVPIALGVGAAALAFVPFTLIPLPFFTAGTALMFGVSVGAGVAAGSRDIRTHTGYIEGP